MINYYELYVTLLYNLNIHVLYWKIRRKKVSHKNRNNNNNKRYELKNFLNIKNKFYRFILNEQIGISFLSKVGVVVRGRGTD